MAQAQEKDDFEFEIEDEQASAPEKQSKGKPEEDVEIVDDTPEEDRGRTPLPREIVEELEQDELEEYSDKVKTRLKQMKKVWHDERREKERAVREQQEAITFAQKILEENKRLKATLTEGEKTLINTTQGAAELEYEMAKKAYKEAYESGESDAIVEAQSKLAEANWKLQRSKEFKPTLQTEDDGVKIPQTTEQPQVRLDARTQSWQQKNTWWGTDPEMTALALGYHQKLEQQHGKGFVGSDDYWESIDKTMRKRFPDYDWGDEEVNKTTNGGGKPVARTEKPATVVAPASRSTSSKKVVLKASELGIAKRLNLTPEQYAKEKMRLENQNG